MRFAVVHGDITLKDCVYLKVKDVICVVYKIPTRKNNGNFCGRWEAEDICDRGWDMSEIRRLRHGRRK